jgi:formylglycine-generating enzyme required for sulfatase activity
MLNDLNEVQAKNAVEALGELKRLDKKLQLSGNLEKLLALRKLLKDLKSKGVVNLPKTMEELKKQLNLLSIKNDQAFKAYSKGLKKFQISYLIALKRKVKTYTKLNKIDTALVFQAEINTLDGSILDNVADIKPVTIVLKKDLSFRTIKMKPIKAGSFMMSPNTEVEITQAFWIGETEVTQTQWLTIMGSNPSMFKGANNPVEQVSWNDCQEFVKKLNKKYSFTLPKGYQFSLPTEAQRYYAWRAGRKKGEYAGNLGSISWYRSNSGRKSHTVATKKPNPWGLYDMHGNVWKWCLDWKADYPSGKFKDPVGPKTGTMRVFSGCCWNSKANKYRHYRNQRLPDTIHGNVGLRLILSQPVKR